MTQSKPMLAHLIDLLPCTNLGSYINSCKFLYRFNSETELNICELNSLDEDLQREDETSDWKTCWLCCKTLANQPIYNKPRRHDLGVRVDTGVQYNIIQMDSRFYQ